MTHKEKPLPKPPNQAFGNKKRFEMEDEQSSLIADRMAAAMAEGKLDEFIKQEMPDNEYARNLTSMMLGMTGMLPMGGAAASPPSSAQEQQPVPPEATASRPEERISPEAEVPEDVRKAIESGDVKGLKEILRREYLKRTPGAEPGMSEEAAPSQPQGMPAIDKELIDAMIQIAKDNSVTMDWMILRAIKVYVQEYQKTGRL